MENIGIIGGGTWGAVLARMLRRTGHRVQVWMRHPERIQNGRHPNLPQVELPADILFTDDIETVCRGKALLIFAVPSVAVRQTAELASPFIPDGQIIADVAKGIEPQTHLGMCGILSQVLTGPDRTVRLVALSGPTHAEEVGLDMPTAIVAAAADQDAARFVQDICMNTCMRVYTNSDMAGVELCGAMKNIIALAVGIAGGLGVGDNGKAAIITRGAAEIARLGVAMGCREETFFGLAGIGDLIVTAMSVHSRNSRAGLLIGQGLTPAEAVGKVGMVVEGLNALPAVMELSRMYGVELPITAAVDAVVAGRLPAREVLSTLMNRERKAERH